jgi:hypothetical protein
VDKEIRAAKKIVRMCKEIKVKKVFASMVLNKYGSVFDDTVLNAVVRVQRLWRIRHQAKFKLYR